MKLLSDAQRLLSGDTLPPSFSHLSTAFIPSLFAMSLIVFLPIQIIQTIVEGFASVSKLLSIHAAFSCAANRCVSRSSVGASTAVRATANAERAVLAVV